MSFLPNSIDLLENETLESVLLRLCRANHFEHYNDLSIEIKSWLEEFHPIVAGAFPLALDAVNVYHAKHSSAQRVQALQLLEQLVGLPRFSFLDISFKHSGSVDLGQYAEVLYKQTSIPKRFLRTTNIPVCTECLKESNHARFEWHINKIDYCEKHNVKLLTECPSCHTSLNYMISEDPSKCICGQDLLSVSQQETGNNEWRSREDWNGNHNILSQQLAMLLFMEKFFPDTQLDEFLLNTRSFIRAYLLSTIKKQTLLATDKTNRLAFGSLSCNFLNELTRISSLPVELRTCIANEVIELALNTPRSTIANIGDSLVSIREASLITGSSIDDLYRLYESGILLLGRRIRNEGRLESFNAVFRLRDVASLALSYSHLGYRQSAW